MEVADCVLGNISLGGQANLSESCLINTFEQANDSFLLSQIWVYLSLFNYRSILLGIFNLGS